MATWLNADTIHFPLHATRLSIPLFRVVSERLVELLGTENVQPREVAAVIEKIITDVRPDLTGLQLVSFGYNAEFACWDVVVLHPKLPEVPFGGAIAMETLEEISPKSSPDH